MLCADVSVIEPVYKFKRNWLRRLLLGGAAMQLAFFIIFLITSSVNLNNIRQASNLSKVLFLLIEYFLFFERIF